MPLTDKEIKALKPQATRKKYFDGNGLYLEVSPNGGKWWRLKYYFQGKDKRVSLGTYPVVSLKEAREKAAALRLGIRSGDDPLAEKKTAIETPQSFTALADEWYEKQSSQWTPRRQQIVRSWLDAKVFPHIGHADIKALAPQEILALCRVVEQTVSAYTAHEVLALISRIMRYGVACGYISSDPCRDLKGALTPYQHKNMPAITEPTQVGLLALKIDGYQGQFVTKSLMQIMLLCMCRTGEARGALWSEIDLDGRIWRIPAGRMKLRREHLIPLSKQALEIFSELKKLTGENELVFPSFRSKSRRMSDNTVNAALRNLGYAQGEVVGHGFRSTASTLLNELGWAPDVIEAQLAHASQGSVRAAYNRAAWLDDRRRMMQAWADHLDMLKEKAARWQKH